MIISATKDNTMYFAQTLKKMAEFIGIEPDTLRRWRRSGLKLATYNDFIIYFNTEKI